MRNGQSHLYNKKGILPWYDSEWVRILILIFMFFVFVFGIFGIIEANSTSEYRDYQWVPILLIGLSGCMIISIITRMVKRYTHRDQHTYLTNFHQDF